MTKLSLGQIGQAANGLPQAEFTKIKIKDAGGYQTIWDNWVFYEPLDIVAGKPWEIRAHYRINSPTGGYAAFVTVALSTGEKTYNGNKFVTGGAWYDQVLDIQMGVVPSSNFRIDRLKLWTCNAYTDQPPAQSEW